MGIGLAETISLPAESRVSGSPVAQQFGEYELLEEIARGGMGVVYKARQKSLGRIVALKLILSGQFASKQEVLRFRGEAEAAANLRHPNIVAIYETGEQQGQHYFSMEYVPGRNLAEIVRDGPLPAQRAARYSQVIARAIHHAHQQGTLHRDLKPSNVLIDADDQPRVTDFGLAKRMRGDFGVTVTGQVLGSPGFMPPEQTSGRRTSIGPASDVYGVGAILYHLVTGRAPFQADTIAAVLQQVQEQEPVAPRLLNSSVPRDLETICLKCLEKDPTKRYATALELADELGRFLRDEPIQSRPIGRTARCWRWCRRKPVVAGLLAAVVAVLTLGITGVLWQSAARRQALIETRRQLYAADMKGAQQAWTAGNTELLRGLLEKHRPESGQEDLRGFEWRYLWRLLRQDDRAVLYPQPGGADAVSFSANDRSFVSVCRGRRTALLWHIKDKGAPQPVVEFTNVVFAAFSPTQPVLALADPQGRIRFWDLNTERDMTLTVHDGPEILALAFTPNGAGFASARTNEHIRLWSTTSGELTGSFEHNAIVQALAISPDGRWLGAASASNTVRIWSLGSGRLHSEFTLSADKPPNSLSFSSQGNLLAVGSEQYAKLWDVERGHFVDSFAPLPSTPKSLAISPDGRWLAVGGWGGSRFLDLQTKQDLQVSAHNRNLVEHVVFSGDGKFLGMATARGVLLRNLQPVSEFDSLPRYTSEIRALAISPDDQILALGLTGEIGLWNLPSGEKARVFPAHDNRTVQSIAFTRDGQFMFSGGDDSNVRIWDLQSGRSVETITGETWVRCVAVSPDGKYFAATVGGDFGVDRVSFVGRVWELATKREVARLSISGSSRALCFSPDGKHFAVANGDGLVRVWDTRSWRVLGSHSEHAKPSPGAALIHGCAFLRDRPLLATGDNGGRIVLWDAVQGRVAGSWQAHSTGIRAMALSPDGRTLATGSYDGTVTLWHTATWRAMLTFDHPGTVYALAFSLNGQVLATGCEDGIARLWRAASGDEVESMAEAAANGAQ
jgi:WD40 repeat protein/tRNA A-37 threonylcarbamoyl transferase component Bud32